LLQGEGDIDPVEDENLDWKKELKKIDQHDCMEYLEANNWKRQYSITGNVLYKREFLKKRNIVKQNVYLQMDMIEIIKDLACYEERSEIEVIRDIMDIMNKKTEGGKDAEI
jgi:hypothetical protein